MPLITEEQIARAFARIEEELLDSMIRNLDHHRVEQIKEGREWDRWQLVQLTELRKYSQANMRKYARRFDEINKTIDELIEHAYDLGLSRMERLRLRLTRFGMRIVRGARRLLGVPEERLDALVGATRRDLMRAEYAVLRQADDIYRQVIFDAQAYATSGAATYAQAIDMATNDFLNRGITGITYRNGSRHTIREYSQMAVRTATKRAALVAEGKQRQEWGIHTIFVNYRTDACPQCMAWVGQVLVDDVYSGGTREEAQEMGYALLSDAMAAGLFHPNCRDTATTFIPGVTELPPKPTEADIRRAEAREGLEDELSNAKAAERRYKRVADFSLEPSKRKEAKRKEKAWKERAESLEDEASQGAQ